MGTRGPISGTQRTRTVDQTRKLGNPGKRPLIRPTTLAVAEMVHDAPPVPADLGASGAAIWRKAWSAAPWLNPELDDQAVLRFVRLVLERQTYTDALAEIGPLVEVPVASRPRARWSGRSTSRTPPRRCCVVRTRHSTL
ncbi:MAG: hypothetical protein ABSH29_24735 [Acidimicrobiales bacterium]